MRRNRKRNPYWLDVAQDKKVQNKIKLKFASWNIRTMLDRQNADRPERRSAIISLELSKYNIDIAALSEVRFSGTGHIREEAGYSIYWSGKAADERSESGVALAIRTELVSKLIEEPKAVSDRMMTLRVPLSDDRWCTVIAVYAPTMTNSLENINQFYHELNKTLRSVPAPDKIILMGDFNARIGQDHSTWPGVIGKFGCGKLNTNGELLLSTCTEHQLSITNTFFQHKSAHKYSWMHPRSKHCHLIDFVITRQRDLPDILDTRAMRGVNCSTDHIMIRTTANLKVRRKMREKRTLCPKLNVTRLKLLQVQEDLELALTEQFAGPTPDGVEAKWEMFKDIVCDTSMEHLGTVNSRHEDWFDENNAELQQLIETRNQARNSMLSRNTRSTKAKYRTASRKLTARCRELKNDWWLAKAAELQVLADTNDMRGFYQSMRAVWGPRISHPDQLLACNQSTLLTEKQDLLNRWTEHFSKLLNEAPVIDQDAVNNLRQAPVQNWMDRCPEIDEISKAIDMISDGKSPGSDGIHPEVIKRGGQKLLCALHEIIQEAWNTATVPQDWKDAQLVTIFKKGDRRLCGNYRGISLLSIPGKVFARVLLNRLSSYAEGFLPEAQCGFRSGRGTADMIFSLKQLQEKSIEQNMPLYMIFIDFTKAFDTVDRTTLWKMLLKLGFPGHFTNLISALHTGMKASVKLKGELSSQFQVNNGVKQGCVLAPTLFSIFLSVVLHHAFNDCNKGVWIQSRPGADLFNVNQYKSTTRTRRVLVRELMFADDTAFVAHNHDDAQEIVSRFARSAQAFGLKINIKKTEMLYQPAPGSDDEGQPIYIDNEQLASVHKFKYLGSTVMNNNKMDEELNTRMSNASTSYGRLKEKVWHNKDLTFKTKCSVYRAVVLSSLLYGAEAWPVYKLAAHKLNTYMMRHLRQILNVKWWDFISNADILTQANLPSMYELLIQRNLRWAGHINRMDDSRLPKQILYSQLKEGVRGIGRPRLRFKDTVKRNLKDKKIPVGSWQSLSRNRCQWRDMVHKKSSSDTKDS